MSELLSFLRELRSWDGCAHTSELRQIGQSPTRQLAKRMGLVTFEYGYWRLTGKGREELLK